MATIVPAPTLDTRTGDQVTASAITNLPSELSDRSNSNPAVVIIEAQGVFFDKLIYQINQWPQGVIEKCLNLIGVTLLPASSATTSLTFTLSAPQSIDTTILAGTNVSNADGSVTFSTTSDLTIPAYTTPTGTAALTAGSATVTGSGTSFVTGPTWVGWQIQIPAQTGSWYTIASVSSTTSLTLTSSASITVATSAFSVGPVSGSVNASATSTGSATNLGAAKLTTLTSSPAGVSSATNNAAATGGNDTETSAAAVARAPSEFCARDVACSADDYALFAQKILGTGGRAVAKAGVNDTVSASGYVTVGSLSPNWTTTSSVSALERAAVVRDLNSRSFVGATLIDVPATITSYTPTIIFWRKSGYDEATVRCNIAAAINSYLSPNTYPFGRSIYLLDLVAVAKTATGVDRIEEINGIPCAGAGAQSTTSGTIAFVNGNGTGTASIAGDVTAMTAGRTVIIDSINKKAYLVTAKPTGTTINFADSSGGTTYTGASVTQAFNYFTPSDTTFSATTDWYKLPFSALSTTVTSPPATIICAGIAS